jgi:hypothetical protein
MSEATFRRTSELADGFGAGEIRAEDLIAASRERYTAELRAAQLLDRDEQATAELDWDKAAKACSVDPEAVLDASVRGDYIILVVEGADGRTYKVAGHAADASVEVSPAAKRRAKRGKAKAKRTTKAKPKAKPKAEAEAEPGSEEE